VKFYSMTIDGWTSHQSQHYLNFFIYFNGKEIVKVALWIKVVEVFTINENEIKRIIQEIVKKFELDGTIMYTTDGGSDIQKALKLIDSEKFHCIFHILNLSISAGLPSIDSKLIKLITAVKLFKYGKGAKI
jgi:hypothetical protein